ncbi:MAG TPA: Crp/Fnr family transcriptional regulator [Bacillota bacterium]|nr:Crp/Fnr family transcriptional regulator [Bacillota bacterium]HOL10208.1 Crp/Fnr family transcriptional regulator [Bacillota bacterium]HPO97210.1 Crp/Fnr family transcriptional regulator [Bacillota bacterium]
MVKEEFTLFREKLLKVPLFQGIDSEELSVMLGCIKPQVVRYKKNECLAIAGNQFSGMGLILAGKVSISKENVAGDRVMMTILGPGEIFGEMVAFSKQRFWPATVIAEEESQIVFIASDKIVGNCERQCGSHRRLILNMLRIISDKALFLNRKLEYLTIKTLRGKIATFLLEQYQKTGQTTFMLEMNRDQLADFLNVSRPSLSREMGRMKAEQLIDFHRSSVQIKSLEKLIAIVTENRS